MSSNHKREQKEEIEKLQKSQKIVNKMEISPYLSMITLNVNGLNFPIERYRQSRWMDLKKHPSVCCLQETHFRYNDTERLRRGNRERYALQMEI